jgi:hypothetical protein
LVAPVTEDRGVSEKTTAAANSKYTMFRMVWIPFLSYVNSDTGIRPILLDRTALPPWYAERLNH